MREKEGLRRLLVCVELVLMFLLVQGGMSTCSHNNVPRVSSNSVGGYSLTHHISQLVLVGALMPWSISEAAATSIGAAAGVEKGGSESGRAHNIRITSSSVAVSSPGSRRKAKQGLPYKKTSANNVLLSNIDFLTQLTNSKQEKSTEMDPLKCFPKALCGLSAESAAITRSRKNGLISDYIRLMKAVALNPSVMEDTMKKLKQEEELNRDEATASDSDASDDEDDEEDDEEDEDRRRSGGGGGDGIQRRSGQVDAVPLPTPAAEENVPTPISKTKKKKKKKQTVDLTNSEELNREYLRERAEVEKAMFDDEEGEGKNWWAYENEKEDPSLEALVDVSGDTRLDSESVESYYTFGGKRKPKPPKAPEKPLAPPQPQGPKAPPNMPERRPPPMLKPPANPLQRYDLYDKDEVESPLGNFFRNLFSFGSYQPFKRDPFFEGFTRALPDGTPTVVTVDKTKEILTTAIEIGETLKSPNQCNSLFNGCKYQYIELLHVIDEIRDGLADKGKYGFQTSFYDSPSKGSKKGSSSYGYKTSLAETSQAETLVPDYEATESKITSKRRRRQKKKQKEVEMAKPYFRDGKMSYPPNSPENSVEIGSDEPTMYGSAQQNFDFNRHRVPQRNYKHNLHTPPQYQNPYSSYELENAYLRQPKSIWATILSWFGFRR